MAEKFDLDHLRQWIGRTEEKTDIVTAHLVAGLRSALFLDVGKPKDGDAAPFTAHWCLTLPVVPMSEVGADGHPKRGGFLPPVPLPRRMWAGGEINFAEPLRVGDVVTRTSTIKDLTLKSGSTGLLCFVSVDHVYKTPRGVALRERHDIVYREMPASEQNAGPAKPQAASAPAKHSERHLADPVLLFRYSALTFNGHRIHYDRDYVTRVEGYPGLIVHGPLQAALLIELAAKLHGGKAPATFVYRGLQPLFDGSEFSVNASDNSAGMELWTANAKGEPTMKGTASW
ncbi:MAG: MaoC family dehydratase N-terminal domain-containing protein [Bradyrhizobium sp.]